MYFFKIQQQIALIIAVAMTNTKIMTKSCIFPKLLENFFNTFQLILNYTVALVFTCARQFGRQPQNFQQIQVINWSI